MNVVVGDVRERAESTLVSYDVGWRWEDCNGMDVCFETGEMDVNVRERWCCRVESVAILWLKVKVQEFPSNRVLFCSSVYNKGCSIEGVEAA
jgi:hypothetical protein